MLVEQKRYSKLPNSKEQCKSSFFAVHIHEGESCSGSADDFHTQPSGNAGTKMACGVVRKVDKAVQS